MVAQLPGVNLAVNARVLLYGCPITWCESSSECKNALSAIEERTSLVDSFRDCIYLWAC